MCQCAFWGVVLRIYIRAKRYYRSKNKRSIVGKTKIRKPETLPPDRRKLDSGILAKKSVPEFGNIYVCGLYTCALISYEQKKQRGVSGVGKFRRGPRIVIFSECGTLFCLWALALKKK